MNATATTTALDSIARALGATTTTLGGNVRGIVIHRAAAEVTLTVEPDGEVIVSALPVAEIDEAEERGTCLDPMVHAAWADAPTSSTIVVLDAIERAVDKLRAAGRLSALVAA